MNVAEVAKELGKRWETLPERARFEEMATKDKERYERVGSTLSQLQIKFLETTQTWVAKCNA